jgi:dihydroorotase
MPMHMLRLVNARLVNEGHITDAEILIRDDRIERVGASVDAPVGTATIDLGGAYLLPGLIDDQVHFREPGLTHKASIASESAAAVCGGVTSFLDMPNTSPPTVERARIDEKKAIAAADSQANFGFYLGATNDNLDEIRRLEPGEVCGVKVFMGSSTGNMLVDDPTTLERIFAECPTIVVTHCEDTPTILRAEQSFRARYGDDVPMAAHAEIRSAEACYLSSRLAVELARRHATRLHVLHLSTAKEMELFAPGSVLDKRITAEVCVHYLWFDDSRYADLGSKIKCNPSIKSAADRQALLEAVRQNRIDVIATDHAPHTREEKMRSYFHAPSGLPLVQHSLAVLLELFHRGDLSLTTIVEKAAHNPARLFRILERGFVREGYFADFVAVDLGGTTDVTAQQLRYKCGWSPFEGERFHSRVVMTLVNGRVVYRNGEIVAAPGGQALRFGTA